MNKIYIIITIFISGFSWAQVSIFENLEDFQSAYAGELMFEDFADGPEEPFICGTEISAVTENDCFAPGELIEGFALTSSNQGEVVFLPSGFLPSENQTPRLGANSGVNSSIVNFEPHVYALGFSLHTDSESDFHLRAYSAENSLLYESELSYSPFVGMISDKPIARIELDNSAGGGELLGDLRFGTTVNLSSIDPQVTQFSYYPNPVQDILHIDSKEKISEITIYDLTGREILSKNSFKYHDYTIDLSDLTRGSYLVKIKLNEDFKSFQIIKK